MLDAWCMSQREYRLWVRQQSGPPNTPPEITRAIVSEGKNSLHESAKELARTISDDHEIQEEKKCDAIKKLLAY
jgi:hypothetical protein